MKLPLRTRSVILHLRRKRLPGQLVIQLTDQCNASCPQCGMRITEKFPRSRLSTDRVKRILDGAARVGVEAVSFTGGEPFLFFDALGEESNLWSGTRFHDSFEENGYTMTR